MNEEEFRTGKGVAHDEQPEQRQPSPGKDTNPKAAFGDDRVPMSTVPATVLAELGVALLEGALKYGRHNYRVVGGRASTYYDAAMRHLMKFWEGEDIDPDSGMPHLTKVLASIVVLRDTQIAGLMNDDRPPKAPADFFNSLNAAVVDLRRMFPRPKEPYLALAPTWRPQDIDATITLSALDEGKTIHTQQGPAVVRDDWISLRAPTLSLDKCIGPWLIFTNERTISFWMWDELLEGGRYVRTQSRPPWMNPTPPEYDGEV